MHLSMHRPGLSLLFEKKNYLNYIRNKIYKFEEEKLENCNFSNFTFLNVRGSSSHLWIYC
jgi:hypothetical protein